MMLLPLIITASRRLVLFFVSMTTFTAAFAGSGQPAGHQQESGTLILCGGALTLDDQNSKVVVAIKELVAPIIKLRKPVLASIQSGSMSSLAAKQAWLSAPKDPGYEEMFTGIGLAPFLVPLALDNYDGPSYLPTSTERAVANDPGWAAKVEASDIVFLNGGDQIRHVRSLLRDDGSDSLVMAAIRKVLNRSGVLIGTSAGTHVQGQAMFGGGVSYDYLKSNYLQALTRQDQLPKVDYERNHDRPDEGWIKGKDGYLVDEKTGERYPTKPSLSVPNDPDERLGSFGFGLGLFKKVLFDSHAGARGRPGRMLVALAKINSDRQFHNTQLGIGVDENTCLFWNRETKVGRVFGNHGIWIVDIAQAKSNPPSTKPFTASGVRLSYLTHGDSFALKGDFTFDKIMSSKTKKIAARSGKVDLPGDIFAMDHLANAMGMLVGGRMQTLQTQALPSDPAKPKIPLRFRTRLFTRLYGLQGPNGEILGDTDAITVDQLELSVGR